MGKITILNFIAPILAITLSPLLLGIIAKTKAFFAGRNGPPVLQTYYDILRLLKKGAVYSNTTSWIFKAGPIVSLCAITVAACIIPFGKLGAPISFSGDVLLFVYMLAMARFFIVIAALDTGSPFEGMGASREAFFSALAEPVLFLCILALARSSREFGFTNILGEAHSYAVVTTILTGASLFVVMLAENARIPVDDPATHLELTMIHEVMVLDHSGPDFAFITYGSCIKLWITGLFVVRTIVPFHSHFVVVDICVTLAGLALVAVGIGIVESVTARLRLLRVPQLLVGAAAIAALALVAGEGGILL